MQWIWRSLNTIYIKPYLIFLAILGLILTLSIHPQLPITAQPTLTNQNSILTLVQTGKSQYDAGRFSQAVETLKQAANKYQATGDKLKQAQILGLLSLAYQKLGEWQAAEAAINHSLTLLNSQNGKNEQIHAQVLNAQGHLQLLTGKAEAALETWQEATRLYAQAGDEMGVLGSQINQAEAMQMLGLYRRGEKLFAQIKEQLNNLPDSPLKVTGLRNLGNLLRLGGDLAESQQILTESLAVAQRLSASYTAASETLLSLGNTERTLAKRAASLDNKKIAENHSQAALNYYQKAAATSLPLIQIQAALNQLSLLIDLNQLEEVGILRSQILTQLTSLPASRESVYAYVNLAENLIKIIEKEPKIANPQIITEILETAIKQAKNLADKRAESYAIGTLGKLSEKTNNWKNAEKFTKEALLIAQKINSPDIAYQWQWQLGRILKNQQNSQAITYYSEAFNTLNNLRSELVALNPEIQFSFRENVEPVYRELVDLLLKVPSANIENLTQARNVIEALQIAELDNFFRNACARLEPVNIDKLDSQAAIVYPIVLKDRLEIIIKLPGKDNLRHYTKDNISEDRVDEVVQNLLINLVQPITRLNRLKEASQQIYDWLIKPLETDLVNNPPQNQIKTLVFVLDSSLRNIPPAVLYDGKQYLIEKYAVVVTPGLQLINPKPLSQENLRAIVAGSASAPSFQLEGLGSIDNVTLELAAIEKEIDKTVKLENEYFTVEKIQNHINSEPFNIVHIATHGQFSSNLQETFILDWYKRIKVSDLDNLLRSNGTNKPTSVDLLTLSACETATGDKRAALGLAGVAIRAGASSTLATLWQIDDASTAEFMTLFYQKLSDRKLSKAEALRNTQIAFLTNYANSRYKHPFHWSAFILVGNWL
ncbi:CHAT domain-containing protein [Aerosakkonemataceae cyanobacterium BLCC-F154]|uniref:CHAT domain-containing protein n=1 Tax=Floridaenema fluviatile BLCC-F154 TaxID=3153640 RepID=A0ABV4YFK1_9CYAN